MAENVIPITLDSTELKRAIDALLDIQRECPGESIDVLVGLLRSSLEFRSVEGLPALGANDVRIVANVADGFWEAFAATRARNVDSGSRI